MFHCLHGVNFIIVGLSDWRLQSFTPCNNFFFLVFILPTERCHTDDLLPDLPVPCLPPRRVHSKVLGLNDRSQPDARRVSSSQMAVAVRRRRQGDGLPLELTEPGARRTSAEGILPFQRWQTGCDAPNCLINLQYAWCMVFVKFYADTRWQQRKLHSKFRVEQSCSNCLNITVGGPCRRHSQTAAISHDMSATDAWSKVATGLPSIDEIVWKRRNTPFGHIVRLV